MAEDKDDEAEQEERDYEKEVEGEREDENEGNGQNAHLQVSVRLGVDVATRNGLQTVDQSSWAIVRQPIERCECHGSHAERERGSTNLNERSEVNGKVR